MSQHDRRHHFARGLAVEIPLRLRAGGGGIVPPAQRLAHLDMRSSEPPCPLRQRFSLLQTPARLTSKLAQVLEQRPPRGLSSLAVVLL